MSGDVNKILRAWLVTTSLTDTVGQRIYCPRLPERATLPAIGFFVRGGGSNAHIPPVVEPSFQFDCWGKSPIEARSAYTALYDVLQGVENQKVTLSEVDYYIKSAVEEVQGQDIADADIPNYYRVIAFYRIIMQI